MNVSTLYDTQVVGSLPVLVEYFDRIKLAEAINETVPWEGEVPLGTLVEVLVLNRLLNPKAMFRIDAWANESGVAAYYGLKPGELNDDRLGRALERVAKHTDAIQAPLVMGAVRTFELEVSQIHYDLTSVEFFGAYEQATSDAKAAKDAQSAKEALSTKDAEPTEKGRAADETADDDAKQAPLPTYGRSKSGRKHVKQIQAGINVTGDGAVPVAFAVFDGNTAESTTHPDNIRRLKEILPKSALLYIADSKLDSEENFWRIIDAKGKYLCGGAFNVSLQKRFLKHRKDLEPVKYWPKSQDKLPPEERDEYRAFELPDRLQRTVDGKKQKHDCREIYVWSESKQRQEIATRERHVAKITAAFEAIERNLNRYTLKDESTIVRRLEKAKGMYQEGSLFEYTLSGRKGSYKLTWSQNAKAVSEWKKLEGVFVLKTNESSRKLPLGDVLAKYREQNNVEKRIGNLKGPLAVAPMFLKNPERIEGLLSVLVWALMVMSLMERAVRRKLKGKPLYGLYPENRPSAAPTGPAILECFARLCVVIVRHGDTERRHLAEPTATQRKLLQLLGIPPSKLEAFKKSSGLSAT
jgi:transposase